MGKVVRLHDGLRALYPEAVVFAGIGTPEVAVGIDDIRSLRGHNPLRHRHRTLSVAVGTEGIVVWCEAPLVILRVSELAAIGIDEGSLDLTAVVAGSTSSLRIPLAVPTEAAHIADRVLVALAGRTA